MERKSVLVRISNNPFRNSPKRQTISNKIILIDGCDLFELGMNQELEFWRSEA